jgi:hypothetical protein
MAILGARCIEDETPPKRFRRSAESCGDTSIAILCSVDGVDRELRNAVETRAVADTRITPPARA